MADDMDISKIAGHVIQVILGGFGIWLWNTTNKTKDTVLVLGKDVEKLEEEHSETKEQIEKLAKGQVSEEQVRRVIMEELERALDRRDKQVVERRTQYDELHQLKMQAAVEKKFEELFPRIRREIHASLNCSSCPGNPGNPGSTPRAGGQEPHSG